MLKQIRNQVVILFITLLIASPLFAASHREAPLISMDPTADITDFYAFRSWEDPSKAVFILNVIPFEEPGVGPNYYNFASDVIYEIHVDTDKSNNAQNIVYQIQFKTELRPPADVFPLSYVANPPITALDGHGSEGLLLRQTYVVFEKRSDGTSKNLGQGTMFAVPSYVGPRTMPDYESLAFQGIYKLSNGGRVFAGQRDDSFYIDVGGTFDTLNFHIGKPILSVADDANDHKNVTNAVDFLSGFNVHTIAIEVPIDTLVKAGGNQIIGAYATTSRQKTTIIRNGVNTEESKQLVQLSRMGNPLVNEVIIPTTLKDKWNASDAETENQFLKFYCNPALASAINLVFKTDIPDKNRNDIANVLLRYPGNPISNICQGTTRLLSDLLRLDLSIEPTHPENQKRLGILAHDASGASTPDKAAWPNGRRPNDDVTDIALRVVAGVLINKPGTTPLFGDGVNFNIGAEGKKLTTNGIATEFPFLPTPHSGRDRRHIDPTEVP